MPKVVECSWCGQSFQPIRAGVTNYCSGAHRIAAWRWNRRQMAEASAARPSGITAMVQRARRIMAQTAVRERPPAVDLERAKVDPEYRT